MKQVRFIINPNSGTSQKKGLEYKIKEYLNHSVFIYKVEYTKHEGHARELAKRYVEEKVDIVVACGGDGTVNEIANPLIHTKTILAIIPLGSGNGFAGHLQIPTDIKGAIEQINELNVLRVDTCTLNDESFINVAGLGFDGLISYKVKKGIIRGIWMYLKTIFVEMFSYNPIDIDFTIENKDYSGSFATIAIANGRFYGNNFQVAPGAQITDGLLDIVMIKKTKLIYYLLNAYRFLNGSIYHSKIVDHIQAKSIKILNTKNLYYHIDGEGNTGANDIVISIVPSSLNVIIGAKNKVK